ncbi:adenylate kinase family protein [Halocalculus aciditolerans]|uniref:Putative adenylate kinase n=1 Tax=Halocalculus aciditolerans TaxID=1383812 RepID=A0A830FLM8_9EURY|nr:adenylate kinase family protein [Halocalculus aciditolerans]GGL58525.1 adenylate kinase [Halocalculus aciditolerans]
MRVAVTGTPGTGKTTATEHLETALDVVHLNDVIKEEELYTERDEARDSLVVDVDAVREYLDGVDDVLVESHLAHYLDVDVVVVLRCEPAALEDRLSERGEPEAKARENAESEALDGVLIQAVENHGREHVYEVDTTDRTPEGVAREIDAVVAGEREPSAGDVDFTGYL